MTNQGISEAGFDPKILWTDASASLPPPHLVTSSVFRSRTWWRHTRPSHYATRRKTLISIFRRRCLRGHCCRTFVPCNVLSELDRSSGGRTPYIAGFRSSPWAVVIIRNCMVVVIGILADFSRSRALRDTVETLNWPIILLALDHVQTAHSPYMLLGLLRWTTLVHMVRQNWFVIVFARPLLSSTSLFLSFCCPSLSAEILALPHYLLSKA